MLRMSPGAPRCQCDVFRKPDEFSPGHTDARALDGVTLPLSAQRPRSALRSFAMAVVVALCRLQETLRAPRAARRRTRTGDGRQRRSHKEEKCSRANPRSGRDRTTRTHITHVRSSIGGSPRTRAHSRRGSRDDPPRPARGCDQHNQSRGRPAVAPSVERASARRSRFLITVLESRRSRRCSARALAALARPRSPNRGCRPPLPRSKPSVGAR